LYSWLVQCMNICGRTKMNDRKKLTMPKKGEKEIRILKRKHKTKMKHS